MIRSAAISASGCSERVKRPAAGFLPDGGQDHYRPEIEDGWENLAAGR